jgi:hypothetical protein
MNLEIIQNTISNEIVTILDATEKALYMINNLTDENSYKCDEIPSFESLKQYNQAVISCKESDQTAGNIKKWTAQYKNIMLQIGIITDYLMNIDEAAGNIAEPALDLDWKTGKTNAETYREMLAEYQAGEAK